jgi:hypothetical protein
MVASNHTTFAYVKTASHWARKKEICAAYQVFVLIVFQITILGVRPINTGRARPRRQDEGLPEHQASAAFGRLRIAGDERRRRRQGIAAETKRR